MFSAKKLLLIGFAVILLIAIPLTVYTLQQQQEIRSQAQAATTLSFLPPSSQVSPLQKNVDDVFSIDATVDPSTNLVSFVRLEIQYDPTKLATSSAQGAEAFTPNTVAFPSILEGPIYEEGKIAVTLSVGSDPTKAIQTTTKVGTINLRALAATETPTQVTYAINTQVLSIGSSDQASENVLATKTPAVITITGDNTTTPTPTNPVTTPSPSLSPSPTIEVSPSPSPSPSATPEVSLSPIPPVGGTQLPICTLFTATESNPIAEISSDSGNIASGTASVTYDFIVEGNDPDGTIEQVTFNFGDGSVTTITDGLSTNSIQTTTFHTYEEGTYTASAVLTDNLGNVSADSCSQTIVIGDPVITPTDTIGMDTPTPSIADPGPGSTILGIGAFFTMLSIFGAILFFTL